MPKELPETRTRRVIDRCAGCGHCRELMDDGSCLFMPELYRLVDRETAGGGAITSGEMKQLVGLCNNCAICPCTPVHTGINQARDAFVERDGLPANVRLLENVGLVGRLGGAMPRLANALSGDSVVGRGVKRVIGIHRERPLPRFPRDGFDAWARQRGLHEMPRTSGRKVAYFTGCTARYYFPEVAKASVEVLQRNDIAVYLPAQKCCGMPTLLEGDRDLSFALARFNVDELTRCVAAGFDIVCSCPSCAYLLKSVLGEGAQYSPDYRALVERLAAEAKGDLGQVSERLARDEAALTGRANARSAHGRQPWLLGMVPWKVFNDHGYYAAIAGLDRLRVANHSYDLGEYLRSLHLAGQLCVEFGVPGTPAAAAATLSYFAPCHQRQQAIGQPWLDLLRLLPGIRVQTLGDGFDCCGQSGVKGVTGDFYENSRQIGARLRGTIQAAAPQALTTDCLSCKIAFERWRPATAPVAHPVELLRDAYRRFCAPGTATTETCA